MAKYQLIFFRSPINSEIGPQSEVKVIESETKKRMLDFAKVTAKSQNWRFIEARII